MLEIDYKLTPQSLLPDLKNLFELAGQKINLTRKHWDPKRGTPVFTENGQWNTRGWTEWTQGFQFGCAIIQFEATGDEAYLDYGRKMTVKLMAPHVSHIGVHDHGFNNVSTYGNLRRLMREGTIPEDEGELNFYEMALKVSGAVQAARWTQLPGNLGYIHSFNGPQSLFSDTIRSVRALSISHQLGHVLMGEQDLKISLLERGLQHAEATARYNVYYGEGRDSWDIRGRVVHESVFNTHNGSYRCASTQQGYSPFTTWTRGHAWVMAGYPEQLEFLETLPVEAFSSIEVESLPGKAEVIQRFQEVSLAAADFYIEQTPLDGIPYWDTGAPGLRDIGDYLNIPADPFNDCEPVDASAAAISAQGLIRLGSYLKSKGDFAKGEACFQAGLTVARRLFGEPYLSTDPQHQGLLLHTVYHRPNNWDYIPEGRKIPCGEATMWGDYHLMELGLLLLRMAKNQPYYRFFN